MPNESEIIDKKWTMLSFPSRWRYDILRVMVYFVDAGMPYDPRMDDAVNLLKSKQRKDGTWLVQAKRPGQVHFDMEKTGTHSRFNTLRSLRVLETYKFKSKDHQNIPGGKKQFFHIFTRD